MRIAHNFSLDAGELDGQQSHLWRKFVNRTTPRSRTSSLLRLFDWIHRTRNGQDKSSGNRHRSAHPSKAALGYCRLPQHGPTGEGDEVSPPNSSHLTSQTRHARPPRLGKGRHGLYGELRPARLSRKRQGSFEQADIHDEKLDRRADASSRT